MSLLESGLFLPWQQRAYSAHCQGDYDIMVMSGGYGSGKTALNTHIMRDICRKKDQIGIAIGRAKGTLQDTIVKTIEEEIPESVINESWISPSYRWTFRTGGKPSELMTKTMQYGHEAKSQLKSINADFGWLVEATTLPQQAYLSLLGRLRRHGSKARYPILIETNPDATGHWVYKTFYEGAEVTYKALDGTHKEYQKWTHYKKNDGSDGVLRTIIFDTQTRANPEYPESTLQIMRDTYSESEYQRMVMGLWVASEGRVWDEYNTFKHPKDPIEYAKKYDRIFMGLDQGQTHPTALVFIGFAGGRYEVFDEYVEQNRSVRGIYSEILKRFETWGLDKKRSYDLYIDPAAKQWKKEFNEMGLEDGMNVELKINAMQSYHRGLDPALNRAIQMGEMFRTKRLWISDLCTCAIQDMEQTVYKEDAIKEIIDKKKYDPHVADAMGYAISKEA